MLCKTLVAAVLFASFPLVAGAATCSADLEGNDAMKFSMPTIEVPKSCTAFTINLKHVGKLPKNVMGHNVVVAKSSDMAGVNADGVKAGLAADYVKPGDNRVIAHSKVIGGGESTSISIPVAKLSEGPYSFFCSFPGHSALMKGTLTVKP
jgi:azurin|nr:G463 [uncultured bacterium]